jgi:hypothetical protein
MTEEWLITRRADKLFLLSVILTLALTPIFPLNLIDFTRLSGWSRVPWNLLVIFGTPALFLLWFGMWRYWMLVDDSNRRVKRFWFFVLLLGFWYGSCLYCVTVYRSQIKRMRAAGA